MALADWFQASLPEVDRHDTSSVYRKLNLRELQQEVPQIKWRDYLQEFAPITEEEPLVAYAMPYLVEMGKIIAKADRRWARRVAIITQQHFTVYHQNLTF